MLTFLKVPCLFDSCRKRFRSRHSCRNDAYGMQVPGMRGAPHTSRARRISAAAALVHAQLSYSWRNHRTIRTGNDSVGDAISRGFAHPTSSVRAGTKIVEIRIALGLQARRHPGRADNVRLPYPWRPLAHWLGARCRQRQAKGEKPRQPFRAFNHVRLH